MKTSQFDQIISEITDYDRRQVARIIAGHIGAGNAITKDDIARQIYGGGDSRNYNDSSTRKVRSIVARLIEDEGLPICANSGQSGYYMPADQGEAAPVLAEIKSRIAKLSRRAAVIEKALETTQQAALFDVDPAPGK